MSKPLEQQIIERARTIISHEEHWCRGALGRDVHGGHVDPTGETALRKCAIGALMAAAAELMADKKQARAFADVAANRLGGVDVIIRTNDIDGHAAVLELFTGGILAMRARRL
jgi:hypothetical protein